MQASLYDRDCCWFSSRLVKMDISDWRKKIDEIDRRLVEFLNERAPSAPPH